MSETIIAISQLKKYYGKHMAIEDVSLTVNKGEIFGFLGSNGSGKSTTIRCLLGLIKATSGQFNLFNDRYESLTECLNQIGYMPSEAMFYPQMKVKDVIAFAAKSHRKDCSQEAKRLCRILEVPVDKKIQDLSLGNRKKVSIVCALQHKPQLLILDEPTSGLDPLMQERFFSLVKEACAAGSTCFLSSHNLSEVKNNYDRLAIIKEGRILTIDTVESLTRSQNKRVTLWKGGQQESFSYNGTSAELLERLVTEAPDDFLVEEPTLEELFMHYYEEGAK
ncbi:ABC transporter ATP-binding protein [Streptococcus moroccensis]|uniref:ABC-2 type transport system ATP-binding protein n=1 Tax=Streptococcus moroccensis TaxID=1451356 RepID=A0ABT9YR18_9STRE|nr:ABC transporter ATP-binding protein [Streptococcus moroccensis]MDQ0221585.1 ABC-2 type transport system ATP-binding protein [Streptococcus moroccensis]